jgi:hypothetical protein
MINIMRTQDNVLESITKRERKFWTNGFIYGLGIDYQFCDPSLRNKIPKCSLANRQSGKTFHSAIDYSLCNLGDEDLKKVKD